MQKLRVRSTPSILIVAPDGREVDWHTGYNPPPIRLLRDLEKSLRGIDTALALAEDYARHPNDVETVFKLAVKYSGRFTNESVDLFRAVLELDPNGRKGDYEFQGGKVKYTEYAEYTLALREFRQQQNNKRPLKAFLKKYPESPLCGAAYLALALSYPEYWEQALADTPDDPTLWRIYLYQAVRDPDQIDKAIELAEARWARNPMGMDLAFRHSLAELYMLKGESEMAELVFGESYPDEEMSALISVLWSQADFWTKWKKHPERAEAAAEAILRIAPEDVGARYQAARLLVSIRKKARALEIFGPEFAKQKWDQAGDLARYISFWTTRGENLEHALAAARRVVEIDSTKAEYWNVLATAFWKSKDYDAAIKAEEEAIRLAKSPYQTMYKRRLDLIKKERDAKK